MSGVLVGEHIHRNDKGHKSKPVECRTCGGGGIVPQEGKLCGGVYWVACPDCPPKLAQRPVEFDATVNRAR